MKPSSSPNSTPSQRGTMHRRLRMGDELWDALGTLAALEGKDRSTVLRELAEGWVKRQQRRVRAAEELPPEIRTAIEAARAHPERAVPYRRRTRPGSEAS